MSVQDLAAERTLEVGTRLKQGHYEVPMLWSSPDVKLPNNEVVAMKRWKLLRRRLRANPELHRRFHDVISSYLTADPPYARQLTDEEASRTTDRTWYLPMHPVTHPHKPEKVRVVNDAAAVFQDTSLNKQLVTGPDFLSNLVGILLRFRNGPIAIAGDIESMFHQVRVSERDADSLRFLWQEDIHDEGPPQVFQMLVHIFGARDSPTCANYAIKRVARDNFHDFSPMTVEAALKSFYVDDLLKAVMTDDLAITLLKELIDLLKKCGMRLTKFFSNSKVVLDSLPASELSASAALTIDGSEALERALGVIWNALEDIFTFIANLPCAPVTKRGILKTTASLFDPMGFLIPFILAAKLILQELWRIGCGWDEVIPDLYQKQWEKWLEGIIGEAKSSVSCG